MWKTLLVLVFILAVSGLLYMAWVKVLKPLHGVSVDSDLREGLSDLMRTHVMPFILSLPNYSEASKTEIIRSNRMKVEAASDKIFEAIVQWMGSDTERKDRFYNDTEPGLGAWLEPELEHLKFVLPDVGGVMLFDDDLFNAVVDCYVDFSKYATNHPDAVEWTAFGFMSWVNLNIDQILEEELRNHK